MHLISKAVGLPELWSFRVMLLTSPNKTAAFYVFSNMKNLKRTFSSSGHRVRTFWFFSGSQYSMWATVYFIYVLFTEYFLMLQEEEIMYFLNYFCYNALLIYVKGSFDLLISEVFKMDICIWLYGYLQSLQEKKHTQIFSKLNTRLLVVTMQPCLHVPP